MISYRLIWIPLFLFSGCVPKVPRVPDSFHDDGKELDKDFSSIDYYSQSNAENFSVFDDIIRLNNISLQIVKQKDYKYGFLVYEDADILDNLFEGDMVMDYRDKFIRHKFIIFTKGVNHGIWQGLVDPSSSNPGSNSKLQRKTSKIRVTPFGRKLWVSRIIPYQLDHNGTERYPEGKMHEKILQALKRLENVTCIKFRPKTALDRNWLRIFKGTSCYSEIGRKYWRKNRPTKLSIGDWCTKESIITHLLMHALGFFHETTRPDRDSFVKINKSRIIKGARKYFKRHYQYDYSVQNSPYDFRSIMHFGVISFSQDYKRTLKSKFDTNEPLGGTSLTKYDVQKINKMYHCHENGTGEADGISQWTTWSVACLQIVRQGCVRLRQRVCLGEDLSRCKGVDRYGVQDQFQQCKPKHCREEFLLPHWGAWDQGSVCSKTCGTGITTRTRKCDNPAPIKQSITCEGTARKSTTCSIRKCEPNSFDTDFESGMGHWMLNFAYSVLWTRRKVPAKRNTGPKHDHTTGKGYYAVLTAEDEFKENNKVGELISMPMNTSDNDKCVIFYYNMNGASISHLQFYLRVNNKYFKVWERVGHQENRWLRGAFSIPKTDVQYFIIISGKTGLVGTSDLAIDDIQLTEGVCPLGLEGCYDFFPECAKWMSEGRCSKEFRVLILSCCKSCEGEDFTNKTLDL